LTLSRPALHIFLALLILGVGVYFLDSGPVSPVATDNPGAEVPQTYLDDARLWVYAEDGSLRDVLAAQRVDFFASRQERSVLLQPRFYSHDGDQKTWSAYADQGTLMHGPRILRLQDNVTLQHDEYDARMETQEMTINTRSMVATSRVPVRITSAASSMTADSMAANLRLERVNMTDNVETIYVPEDYAPEE